MICEDNFHVNTTTDYDEEVFAGDRILVAKFLKPRRWDLVVFRYPRDPSVNYVMRLDELLCTVWYNLCGRTNDAATGPLSTTIG